jgi:hypothetical protein
MADTDTTADSKVIVNASPGDTSATPVVNQSEDAQAVQTRKVKVARDVVDNIESAPNTFDFELLCSNSEKLFDCHREVIIGAVEALGVAKKEKYSKAEIVSAIENFKKREVKPNV